MRAARGGGGGGGLLRGCTKPDQRRHHQHHGTATAGILLVPWRRALRIARCTRTAGTSVVFARELSRRKADL